MKKELSKCKCKGCRKEYGSSIHHAIKCKPYLMKVAKAANKDQRKVMKEALIKEFDDLGNLKENYFHPHGFWVKEDEAREILIKLSKLIN